MGSVVLVSAVLAFSIFEPIQVLPRIRLAPGFALTDQHGDPLTSDSTRGQVTLYSFAYGDCGEECSDIYETMAQVAERGGGIDLAGVDLRLVTISFDPGRDATRLAEVASTSGADGVVWRWATADPAVLQTVIGSGFKAWYQQQPDGSFEFDPRFVLVDGWGIVRGEYRYSTLVSDTDRLVRHIDVLGEELRNANGVATLAYEAAHVFLCYP